MKLLILLILPLLALAQTQLDIERQGKRVDFLRPPFASPARSGPTLPATCAAGELFFLTSATPGNNLHVCYSPGNWAMSASSGPAQVAVYAGNTLIGSRSAVSIQPGLGVTAILADNGGRINIEHSVNTAVIPTLAKLQNGEPLRCVSTEGSPGVHSCSLMPVLGVLTTGMLLHWKPSVEVSGSATLEVDILGAKAVKLWDGATNPAAGDIPAGALTPIWYDGTVWRVIGSRPGQAASAPRPTCAAAVRGRVWHVAGGTGVADSVSVCAKDAADSYAWRTIY
jgi:hypothetical protein